MAVDMRVAGMADPMAMAKKGHYCTKKRKRKGCAIQPDLTHQGTKLGLVTRFGSTMRSEKLWSQERGEHHSLTMEKVSEPSEQEVDENNCYVMTTELNVVASGPVKKPPPELSNQDPHLAADDALAVATRVVMVVALHILTSSTIAKKEIGALEPSERHNHAIMVAGMTTEMVFIPQVQHRSTAQEMTTRARMNS